MKKHSARRIQTTSTLTIPAPPSRVLPFLCAQALFDAVLAQATAKQLPSVDVDETPPPSRTADGRRRCAS